MSAKNGPPERSGTATVEEIRVHQSYFPFYLSNFQLKGIKLGVFEGTESRFRPPAGTYDVKLNQKLKLDLIFCSKLAEIRQK